MYRTCQVCGNPVFSVNDYGTDADGQINRDYCSNCYKGGNFYSRDWSGETEGSIPFIGLLDEWPGGPGGITGAGF